MPYFLHHQGDTTPDPTPYRAKSHALAAYAAVAKGLYVYGQTHGATLHRARSVADVREYPDFVLALGPRGGVRCDQS